VSAAIVWNGQASGIVPRRTFFFAEFAQMTPSVPDYLSPIQWHQAVAVSREQCARIFRDGGAPTDALLAFGLHGETGANWERVVDLIAAELCAHPIKHAA
jgi:hypothetical protein